MEDALSWGKKKKNTFSMHSKAPHSLNNGSGLASFGF
jgi:hypothetical protein